MDGWSKIETFLAMKKYGVIPTISGLKANQYLSVAEELEKADLPIMELCFRGSIPAKEILDAIHKIRYKFPNIAVGCGTTITAELAQEGINSGAGFIVSPLIDERIIRICHRNGVLVIPGLRTETEAALAMEYGCLAIKILLPFGEEKDRLQFFKTFCNLFPLMFFFPTMGITPENLGQYLKAGAPFVATSTPIIMPKEAVEKRDWAKIGEAANKYLDAVKKARE